MSTVYKNVGNYSHYCEEILKEYSFPDNKRGKDLNYEWPKTRYHDLPTTMMKICHDACESAEDIYLLKSNPFIIVERHHKILSKDGKVKNNFAVHSDRDGPAGGPCRSILFYYQIDEDIDDVGLHFYEWCDEYETNNTKKEPIITFHPVSGDVITFDDNIPHCPGNFKTESEIPKTRGVLAIFIKHDVEEDMKPRSCMSWLSCLFK